MKRTLTLLTALLIAPLAALAEPAAPHLNRIADPGFEEQPGAGRGTWVGTQNAGKPAFERCKERSHSGRWAAKMVCQSGDSYARWVYQTPDLFATVKRGDRLKLSFWYRACAALGDALVMISQSEPPGYVQYPLKRLKPTGDVWVRYEAVFTVAVNPTGGGEVQLRGTTDLTGDQVVYFDDVSLEVVGHEEPRRDAVVLGSLGLTGVYHPDGRVTFDGKPVEEWEFMATGTGVTGLTVNFPDEMVVQVNHSAAIDENGILRALARLHLDLAGRPFATATRFRMEHDLRRSVIRAFAETLDGPVRVELRALVPDDVIRVDIFDERKTPDWLTIRLEEDAPSAVTVDGDGSVSLWHENRAEDVAPGKRINHAHADVQGDTRPWLAGRTFGLAIAADGAATAVAERTLTLPAAARHSVLLAGVSTLGGRKAFEATAHERLRKVQRESPHRFVTTHETWWRDFWAKASFEPGGEDGVLLRHKAAFDLYRYYLACCAGEHRDTPVRFQIDLFRYHLRYNSWMTGMICAVEQYQSFYGAMRTANWEPLRNLASFYERNLPYYRHVAQQVYGHGGARIPMWQSPLILQPPAQAGPAKPPAGAPKRQYNGENPAGALWVLALLCDMVDLTGDSRFANTTLRALAVDLVEFVRLQYPQRDQGRMVIAPCNAGETWQGVRDPAEMVCALRLALPRLIAVGRNQRWDLGLIAGWEALLAATAEIPRGRLQYGGSAALPVILPGDQLVPAADMSGCEAYVLPWSKGKPHYQLNSQQTELFAVWPAKLVLRGEADRDRALQSYRDRLFQHAFHGWDLDVVFAACLGLREEVALWSDKHFARTFVLPCGLARETAQTNPAAPSLPECPSMQGMGTGVIPILEMLLQDYPDDLIVLPCWPEHVPVDFTLYSPYAGRVEVHYRPGNALRVATQHEIRVRTALAGPARLQVERLRVGGR